MKDIPSPPFNRSVKGFFATFIDDPVELDEFGVWAFGDNVFEMAHGIEYMMAWNKLHKDQLRLKQGGWIHEDAPKMVKLWREHQILLDKNKKD